MLESGPDRVSDRASDRVKARLLRELIEENLELKAGIRRPPRHRRPSRLRHHAGLALKVFGLLVAPAAVLASSLVLSGAADPERFAGPLPPDGAAVRAGDGTLALAVDDSEPPRAISSIDVAALLRPPARSDRSARAAFGAGTVNAAVFPLGVRRIVLDPGHGGENLGTRTPGGLEEKFLTLDIARRVREVLEAASFEVVMTREGDEAMTLEERAEVANRRRGDIFVSIHVNWFEGNRDSGIETYYLGPTDDPFLTRLAANENSHSGHTMAEMRDLLDGIYAGVRLDKSQDLAREIHQALYRSLSRVNPQLRDRGVKTAPFIVLVDTEMPAVLAEVAALSSQAEAAMLEKPLYREYIADSLAAGIIAYAQAVGGTPAQKGS
jgi:N-acetylmuramoyl-L-alanine amidase